MFARKGLLCFVFPELPDNRAPFKAARKLSTKLTEGLSIEENPSGFVSLSHLPLKGEKQDTVRREQYHQALMFALSLATAPLLRGAGKQKRD